MKWLVRTIFVISMLLALAAPVMAAGDMPVAPDWLAFWGWVSASAGVIALVLVDILLKYLPEPWKGYVTNAKALVALLANYFVPLAVTALLAKWPTADPLLWSAVYFAGSYLVHEVLYKFIQKPVVARLNDK